ncbi:MAG: tRNA 2-selenouridine(34) synthase MnmH [Chitinophagales bacterium]|nr:tRNA 2-selenouridine(34) synthase MnmH [Chitinophagales bacterium]MCZ2392290.1 tRNA 2-selenouridine(34) synthase MnmH [Chitinophagales bacterium]
MIKRISFQEYISDFSSLPLLDVRTPLEFDHGHILNALNLPLFSNEERVNVGTTYKQSGREKAILLGFDIVGTKWRGFIETALVIAPDKKIGVYCWRGGMRSGSLAWALDFYGFEVYVIQGGYKAYRNWVLQQFDLKYPLLVLGGMTGSHKTEVLKEFTKLGRQVIDLEELAQHKGSAFGSKNYLSQPTQEQFENKLATILYHFDLNKKIWVEDESYRIGQIIIPKNFWIQMQSDLLIELKISHEERVQYLLKEYGVLDKKFLTDATSNIRKRLGPQHYKAALIALEEDRIQDFIEIVLVYYDKAYQFCLLKRDSQKVLGMDIQYESSEKAAQQVLEYLHIHSID